MAVEIEPTQAEFLDTNSQVEIVTVALRIAGWAFPWLFVKTAIQLHKPAGPIDWLFLLWITAVGWVKFLRERPILDRKLVVVNAW